MGQGQNFCGGIDLQSLSEVADLMNMKDSARGNAKFRRKILRMQVCLSAASILGIRMSQCSALRL